MNCRALKHLTQLSSAVALVACAAVAYAQNAPEDHTPPPTPGPTEQPAPQTLPPCPPGGQAAAPTEVVPTPPPPAPAPPPAEPYHAERKHNIVFAPQEISLTTGAGPGNYFGTALNNAVDTGAAWNARVVFGARSAIALEAAYVGSSNTVDTVNHVGKGRLDSNGFDGDLRLQVPTMIEPYVFGGVGYNHMAVSNMTDVSTAGPLSTSDDQVTVPAGGGLTGYIGHHATLDLRGTYRFIPDNGITEMTPNHHLHQWVAEANIGYAF